MTETILNIVSWFIVICGVGFMLLAIGLGINLRRKTKDDWFGLFVIFIFGASIAGLMVLYLY